MHVHVCWCVSLPRNRARLRCSIHVTLRTLRTLHAGHLPGMVAPSICPSCSDMRCLVYFGGGAYIGGASAHVLVAFLRGPGLLQHRLRPATSDHTRTQCRGEGRQQGETSGQSAQFGVAITASPREGARVHADPERA